MGRYIIFVTYKMYTSLCFALYQFKLLSVTQLVKHFAAAAEGNMARDTFRLHDSVVDFPRRTGHSE